MRASPFLLAILLLCAGVAGCLGDKKAAAPTVPGDTPAPRLDYVVPEPDLSLSLFEEEALIDGADGVQIHLRIKRPDGATGLPAVVEFTPYTAGVGSFGKNPLLNQLAEPAGCVNTVGPCETSFDVQFVRRGYAFVYADVRGTGDSSGCLSLRGPEDIADAAKVIDWLGTRPWSNGLVGFIGASYPGSEAHIAAIAEAGAATGHLGAVIPVAASTSFYHYHHNDGVPYNGNHALGGTNTGYTQNALAPTINPQNPDYVTKYLEELECDTKENVVDNGGLDQTGVYTSWWQDRNLRGQAPNVTVPILISHGLADWNVKPDHEARYFNDLPEGHKTFIGGQWGHAYPRSRADNTTCPQVDLAAGCDPTVPWGNWWEYANAFFDTYLKGIDTGMFGGDVAWAQDNLGRWHRSAHWPLLAAERGRMTWTLHPDGTLQPAPYTGAASDESWLACPHDQQNRGTELADVEERLAEQQCANENPVEELVFESTPFTEEAILSGVGLVNLTLTSTGSSTHLVAVLEVLHADGTVTRENYGYLNPAYRDGLTDDPQPLPSAAYHVSIDLYPQEDVVQAGERIRLTVRSNDRSPVETCSPTGDCVDTGDSTGRTIESYAPGRNTILFEPGNENALWLPLRPAGLQGVRLG